MAPLFLILKIINVLTKEQFEEFAELFFNPVSTELSIKFLIDLVKDKEFKFEQDRFSSYNFKSYDLSIIFYINIKIENIQNKRIRSRLLFGNGHPWDRKLECIHNNRLESYYSEEFYEFMESKYDEYKKAKERES